MRLLSAGIAVISLSLAGTLHASPNYNYVELDYIDFDIEPFEGDGWAIGGSALVHPNVFILGRFSDAETDATVFGTSVDGDFEQISIGAGLQSPLQNDNISVFGQLTYEDLELDISGGGARASFDDSGFALEGGARFIIHPQFEIGGSVRFIDVGDFYDGEFGFRVGGEWRALPWLAVNVDYDQNNGDDSDVEQIQAGVRVYWDQLNF